MLKFFLWLRYLKKIRIVLLCVVAVALSVALLITVDSLFVGLIDGLKKSVLMSSGDMKISVNNHALVADGNFIDKIKTLDEVDAAAPLLETGGLLWVSKGDVREAIAYGINVENEIDFTDWSGNLVKQQGKQIPDFNVTGNDNAQGVWVGVALIAEPNEKTDEYDIEQLKQFIGQQVLFTIKTEYDKRKVLKLTIADIAITDTWLGDNALYVPYEQLTEDIGINEYDSQYSIKVKKASAADEKITEEKIRTQWESFLSENQKDIHIIDWLNIRNTDFSWGYLSELNNQREILMLVFGVVSSVTIILVFCIFFMIVELRFRDIAIMKSFGTASISIISVFTGFGGFIGVIGSAIGVLAGFVIISNINILERWIRIITGVRLWQSSSYILKYIPNEVNWPNVIWIIMAAVAGCCIGALLPAIAAARTKPVDILRYE